MGQHCGKNPHWVTEAGEVGREQEKTEGTEAFFQDIYWQMRGGDGREEREGTGNGVGEAAPNGASISLT